MMPPWARLDPLVLLPVSRLDPGERLGGVVNKALLDCEIICPTKKTGDTKYIYKTPSDRKMGNG
jgi:hypothetical protein